MRIVNRNYRNYILFEDKEEVDIFCDFFYNNDFFLRKRFKRPSSYRDSIQCCLNGNFKTHGDQVLYIDGEYHFRLTVELVETINNYRRKAKLQRLDHLDDAQ